MSTKFLDKDGLTYLWTKIKTYINNAIKVTGVKGNAESSYRTGNVNLTAANVGALPISGGTVTGDILRQTTSGMVVPASPTSFYQSPIPKYLWHDIWAFCRARTPTYETSADGIDWITSTLEKNLFAHKEAWGVSNVLTSSIKGSRWTWLHGGFYASTASWLVFGVTYKNPPAHFDVKLETSSDGGTTWTLLMTASDLCYSQTPIWIRNTATTQDSLRLTITWNNNSASNAMLGLCSIRFLTQRWGDQGRGGEFEHPYTWDTDYNISPLSGAKFIGALTGNVTGNVNGHTINSDVPANAKFTDTTYESKPAASGGTDLSLVTTGDKYRWNTAASSGGDVNIIESVKVNGTALTPDSNKAVNVILPSNLLNGSTTGSLRSIGSQAEASSYTIGTNSLALGVRTLAASQTQIALGKYNVSDSNNTYAVIIGNGTANNARSNALTIDWNGNVSIGNNSKTLTYSIRTYNSLHDINLNANTSGNAGIWDSTTSSWMIYNDTNGKTYLGNSTQIYTDGSSLRANTFYTSYNIYCGSAIGTGGRTSYTDVSKSGDWISSDGVIDLVRSNTSGGLIQFHYNYSSSVTSTIEEINSGVIHISGTLTAGQAIRSNASSTDYCKLNGHTAMAIGLDESKIGSFLSKGNSTDLSNNSIYLYANSQGRVGIYSIREDATVVTILSRENNSNTVTFGNSAGNVLTYSYNYSSAPPIVSNTTANHRVSHFYMSTATQLMVHAQGNASSFAGYYITTSSSDIRLKENIQDTKVSALPIINSFKMREFDWKNGDGHQDIGMIADEVEKIDPKLAIGGGYDENGEMNIKTIDTFYLIGYLTKAVQELSAEIEELKKS